MIIRAGRVLLLHDLCVEVAYGLRDVSVSTATHELMLCGSPANVTCELGEVAPQSL